MPNNKCVRIFIDTEFTDFVNCDLISLGMVTESGQEFYGENTQYERQWASDFVKATVLPLCNFVENGFSRSELGAKAWQWLDDLDADEIIILVDYQTDYTLLLDLLGEEHPKIKECQNIFSGFYAAAILNCVAMGTNYSAAVDKGRKIYFEEQLNHFFETKEIEHHALSDARSNRRGYQAMMKLV